MKATPTASILTHFSTIKDPRIDRQKKHQLQDIFFITLCAVISGADNWVMIEEFGKCKEEWFSVRATSDIEWLQERHPEWAGLKSIVAVTAKRELRDKTEEETLYFISSLDDSDPKRLGEVVRAHWAVENNLHWVLDIAFDEDRTRTGYSAPNLAVIRHIALNLIKNEYTSKVGIKTKRAKAGWDNQYLLKCLG